MDEPASLNRVRLPVAWAALALVLGIGLLLRLQGYFSEGLQLWLDEASWANMLVEGTFTWIRPAGYMWLSGVLVSLANNEQTLRALSLLAGVAQLPLAFAVFRRTTSSFPVALFGAWLLALHPVAVAMSKEFKPYAIEATLHTLLVLCALVYLQTSRRGAMIGLSLTAVLAPLFAWSVVFAYPAVFGVTCVRAWRERRRIDLLIGVGGAALTLALLATIWRLRLAGEDEKTAFWGRKYDVFFVGRGGALDQGAWLLNKTMDLLAFPAQLEVASSWVVPLQVACVGLCIVGMVAVIVRRRFDVAVLLLVPWIIGLAFNVAGKWPWGVFRTNVFLLFYVLTLVTEGLSALAIVGRQRPDLWRVAPWGGILIGIALFPFDLAPFSVKKQETLTLSTSVRTAMEKIQQAEEGGPVVVDGQKPILLLDGHACGVFAYYERHHETSSVRFSSFFRDRFTVVCGHAGEASWRKEVAANLDGLAWVIVAKPQFGDLTRELVGQKRRIVLDEEMPVGTLLLRVAVAKEE